MQPSTRLPLNVATAFAHAMVSKEAEGAGIRLISIKGPVNLHYGLRTNYTPSDADFLVDPARFDELLQMLQTNNWRIRPVVGHPRMVELHSVTLIHPDWPCDLDVHRFFPGFLVDRQDVFDLVWADRHTMTIAGRECSIPSLPMAWAITALHAHRDEIREGGRRQLRRLELFASQRLAEGELADLGQFLNDSGAMETLRSSIEPLGIYSRTASANSPELVAWNIRRFAGMHPAVALIDALRSRRYREVARMARSILMEGRPERHDTGLRALIAQTAFFWLQLRRVIAAVPSIPRWYRVVRDARRGRPVR
ncbi:putative nucleotidyltransferase-like protein [Rathayibacter sp. PhB152]|uniref:nucleotidyltransferase family protein n=1 Tax=Rathayibacter sp. PhB152 TaxID=2485190 RepID=UPI000F9D1D1E|nr:nucleotidyltransferase family protein [Rathayibacter sp. PhB152]ROQ63868.1 putative nucleotidyltransferase-like protein [Rathayibacter sp. PhB152]